MPLLIESGELDELHARALVVTGWPILGARQLLYMVHAGWRWQVTNPYGQGHIQPITDDEARWAIEARYREWLESRAKTNREGGRRRDTLVLECYCPWTQPNPYGVDACVKMTDAPTRIDALAKCVLAVAEKVK